MIYRVKLYVCFAIVFFALYSCSNEPSTTADNTKRVASIPVISYAVVNYFPHDSTLFTEGFLIHNGQIFESTGSPQELPQTKSMIGITDLKTGIFVKKAELDKKKYFGEGIVFFKDKLYQLTYKNGIGFIYDAESFKQKGKFTYKNKEGWSFTTDGKNLIMSDGTDTLTFLDPDDLKRIKTLKVTENGMPRDSINELEFIKGYIYANIWINNSVIKIDPASGKVVGKINLSAVTEDATNKSANADVLNGIAYDSVTDKIYVTGKMWKNIYQIQFSH